MAYPYEYPYTDPNRHNDDWAIQKVKDFEKQIAGLLPVSADYFNERYAFYSDRPEDINGRFIHIATWGSDYWSGSENFPVRTVRRAIELASYVTADVRLKFIAEGVYDVNYLVYTGRGLHITATVPNVVLNYTNVGIHYMTHINISGKSDTERITVRCENPRNLWYMDGGQFVFDNVNFECTVRFNGAAGETYRTGFRSLLVFDSTLTIAYKTEFGDPTDSRGAIYLYNSNFFNTTPNLICRLTANTDTNFIYSRGSRIANTQVISNDTGFKWAKVDINQSTLLTSNSAYAALSNFANTISVQNSVTNITLPA
jgi:hypothetical protein